MPHVSSAHEEELSCSSELKWVSLYHPTWGNPSVFYPCTVRSRACSWPEWSWWLSVFRQHANLTCLCKKSDISAFLESHWSILSAWYQHCDVVVCYSGGIQDSDPWMLFFQKHRLQTVFFPRLCRALPVKWKNGKFGLKPWLSWKAVTQLSEGDWLA